MAAVVDLVANKELVGIILSSIDNCLWPGSSMMVQCMDMVIHFYNIICADFCPLQLTLPIRYISWPYLHDDHPHGSTGSINDWNIGCICLYVLVAVFYRWSPGEFRFAILSIAKKCGYVKNFCCVHIPTDGGLSGTDGPGSSNWNKWIPSTWHPTGPPQLTTHWWETGIAVAVPSFDLFFMLISSLALSSLNTHRIEPRKRKCCIT